MHNDNMKANWSKRKDVVNTLYQLSSLIPPAVKPSELIYTGMQLTSATLATINIVCDLTNGTVFMMSSQWMI